MKNNDMSFESLYSIGLGLNKNTNQTISLSTENYDGYEDGPAIELQQSIEALEYLDTFAKVESAMSDAKIRMCKKLTVNYGLKSGINATAANSIESLCRMQSTEAEDNGEKGDEKKKSFLKNAIEAIKNFFIKLGKFIKTFFYKMCKKILGFFTKSGNKKIMDLYNKFVKKLDEIDLKGNYKSNEALSDEELKIQITKLIKEYVAAVAYNTYIFDHDGCGQIEFNICSEIDKLYNAETPKDIPTCEHNILCWFENIEKDKIEEYTNSFISRCTNYQNAKKVFKEIAIDNKFIRQYHIIEHDIEIINKALPRLEKFTDLMVENCNAMVKLNSLDGHIKDMALVKQNAVKKIMKVFKEIITMGENVHKTDMTVTKLNDLIDQAEKK